LYSGFGDLLWVMCFVFLLQYGSHDEELVLGTEEDDIREFCRDFGDVYGA
jgi:hypothetical protein